MKKSTRSGNDRHRAIVKDQLPVTLDGKFVAAFLRGAVLKGHDPKSIIKKAGLDPSLYDNENSEIDGREFQQLFFSIQGETNDIFMGYLRSPARFTLDREQSRVRFQCDTLGEALRMTTQFREAVRTDIFYEYMDDPNRQEFSLNVNYQTVPDVDREIFHWHRLMTIYRYYCWLIGKRIVLNSASFEGRRPRNDSDLRRYSIFDCKIKFDAPVYALAFDKKYLLSPIVRKSDAENADYAVSYPDWFETPGQGASWARQTEQVLVRLQDSGVWSPKIAMVGAMLSIGARSLRRNLAKEETSFAKIKSRVRSELAIAYLMATDHPITLIGEYVGFMEPSDFTRAFITWTGQNPSDFRAKHAGDKELINACGARLRSRKPQINA